VIQTKDLNGGGPNFSLQMSFLKQYYQNFEGFRGCFKHPPPTQKPLILKVPFEVRLFLLNGILNSTFWKRRKYLRRYEVQLCDFIGVKQKLLNKLFALEDNFICTIFGFYVSLNDLRKFVSARSSKLEYLGTNGRKYEERKTQKVT
jgi:hypothetical protein